MQFIDLKAQQDRIRSQIEINIKKVLDHGNYIMGPEVFELEECLANFVGVKHCIAVSSGTDAILISMMALGIGYGDEIITTPFTFIATGEMILLLGAKPVFVDIDSKTYNIDPSKIEAAITPKTRAIMPVSLYGQCADFDAINMIAEKHNLPVIEDGAQSFGATYKDRQSCSLSTIGCTSFFPSKPLGGYGDSGACFTDDENLAKAMREIRVHGQDRRYHHPRVGINGRMDTLQAAILLPKLDLFPEEVKLRGEIGGRYSSMIEERCLNVTPPYIAPGNSSVYAQYTILVNDRENIIAYLNEANVPTAVHYPVPLNKQPVLETIEFNLSVADSLSNKVMSLPMHPYLSDKDQKNIVDILTSV
jgi:UDP-2-acetamido-2-deoxy-ribo-hexuluronate aminotransferase